MLSKTTLQKFTKNTKKIIANAFETAGNSKDREVGAIHLLIGIWQEKGTLGTALLQLHNFQNKNTSKLISSYSKEHIKEETPRRHPVLSLEAKKILKKAAVIASQYSHKYIGTEHILYSIIDSKNEKVESILQSAKIDKKQIKKTLHDIFKDTSVFPDPMSVFGITSPMAEDNKRLQKSILSYFCVNLTQLAVEKKIEPIIGRVKEIERLIYILNRKNKNNPILIGEPGVGKTAIIQGLAIKIAKGEVPETLKNKQILSLDLGLVMAGAMMRGDLEARLKDIIEEIKQIKDIILFIDEIHNIVGAGGANGAMDTANILKPSLSQGKIQCVGATTFDEYRRFIEKDRALERRFQPVIIKEINQNQAIEVITGLRPIYEQYHNLKISNGAVSAAVSLSSRYINDRYLPDKAIDVIDETAARVRSINKYALSPTQKQVEIIKNQLKTIEFKKQELVVSENYQEALNYKQQQEKLTNRLSQLKMEHAPNDHSIEIVEKHIRETIAVMTGIPLDEVRGLNNIKKLEKKLAGQIIGQTHAIKIIGGFIKRANAGIANPNRPWGSFLFLGPTGVGKTELAKKLAEELFGSKESFIKLDMSEFMEKHNVSRLVGAPPGYIGYEEGGKLTERVRRNPYSLILFDEIEKAHPDVFNILLQILEDGTLTDARGTQVNFKNTLIIMTSNIGTSEFSKEASKLGFDTARSDKKRGALDKKYEEIKNKTLQELKNHMRPELINRIDQTLVFKPLGKKEIEKIIDLELKKLAKRLEDIKMTIDESAKKILKEKSFNPREGARLVRRQIQTLIEEPIADVILDNDPTETDSPIKQIDIKTKNGKISVEAKT